MKVGLLQLCSSDRPAENLAVTRDLLRQAASAGASFILTPEVTNCVSSDRGHQDRVLQTEAEDITLAGLRAEAQALGDVAADRVARDQDQGRPKTGASTTALTC